ncbi:MAG TPA: hypothetical protein VLF71_01720 [Candidatus Saccharimonadales bacterium]|nr:hypothetical protein [Candidatus Saccharimonadales bacterium]
MKGWARLQRWRLTTPGLAIFGLAELAISFAFTSRAFDTGSLIEYFLALVFLVAALQNGLRLARKCMGGPKRR